MAKKRKRRVNLKRLILVISIPVLIFILLISQWNRFRLISKGYSFSNQNIILKQEKEERQYYLENDKVEIDGYDLYENQHHYYDYNLYEKQSKKDKESVVSYIDSFYGLKDSLQELGYNIEIYRDMMKMFDIEDFRMIINQNYTYEQVKPYYQTKGFIVEDLKQYIESNLEAKDAILSVSYPFIDSSNEIIREYNINTEKYDVLIKNGFYVDSQYEPDDLVEVNIPTAQDCENNQMREEAAKALETMAKDAKKEKLYILIKSAYRSYSDQQDVYDYYFTIYDPITAASLVAIPGSSEHQLGLSVDLTSQSVEDGQDFVFGDSDEYQWVIKHAHEYGFILRYPEDKTELTGTANEPWHFRYVGKEIATEIYENDWTLEEYILEHGFSYTLKIKE